MTEWLLTGMGIVVFILVAWVSRSLGEALARPSGRRRLRFWERRWGTSKGAKEQLARIAEMDLGEGVVPISRTTYHARNRSQGDEAEGNGPSNDLAR